MSADGWQTLAAPQTSQPGTEGARGSMMSPPSTADHEAAAALYQTLQLCQLLTSVPGTGTGTLAPPDTQENQPPQVAPQPPTNGDLKFPMDFLPFSAGFSSLAGSGSPGSLGALMSGGFLSPLRVQLPTVGNGNLGTPPRVTPPVTPPSSVDLNAVLAQLTATAAETMLPFGTPGGSRVITPQKRRRNGDRGMGFTPVKMSPLKPRDSPDPTDLFQLNTPQKRGLLTEEPPTWAASPVDSLPSGLKRRRVRVLQSNPGHPQLLSSSPSTPNSGSRPVASGQASSSAYTALGKMSPGALASALANGLVQNSPGGRTKTLHPSPTPQKPSKQGQRRIASVAERLRKVEEAEQRSNTPAATVAPATTIAPAAPTCGSWTADEKRELVKVVAELKPHGAGDWERVAQALNKSRPSTVPRRGPSAERMYRSLTDPAYSKTANPHGRRLNPRKGSTPMHVMATYSLQKLPKNEGNLTQITELIAAHEKFASELDWSPRPGTKTYPRWKDALVGCFKPGRYPHLVKTDRKLDGLTIYKLLPEMLAKTQRAQASKR